VHPYFGPSYFELCFDLAISSDQLIKLQEPERSLFLSDFDHLCSSQSSFLLNLYYQNSLFDSQIMI